VERRAVQVGPVQDGVAVIDKGLLVGEQVITDGQFKLKPGAKVALTTLPAETKPVPSAHEAANNQ
jgi:multidrug efflux system membrane fusion protein